ncbi:MAG: hypothetical protein J0L55_02285 [Caulobacterales bacterium]|nr:hypothetical protein [Caulobacterales bacterium]MCA0372169.1 hypothetical protein [Pseudomonadota bacterium]
MMTEELKKPKNKLATTFILGIPISALLGGVGFFLASPLPTTAWVCKSATTKSDTSLGSEPETYVAKVKDEYMLLFEGGKNQLITAQTDKIPKQWLYNNGEGGLQKISENGFEDVVIVDDVPYKTIFDIKKSSVITQARDTDPSIETCHLTDWDKIKKISSTSEAGAPIEYLEARNYRFKQLIKQMGDLKVARTLLSAVTYTRKDDAYSIYHILSRLPPSALTTIEKDQLEAAKKKLLTSEAKQLQLWEFTGGYSYRQYPYNNSEQVQSDCQSNSQLVEQYTQEGYAIVSQSQSTRNVSNGSCQGRDVLLTKEGGIPE